MVVLWEGETYRGEMEFWNYQEAYKYCQERLKNIAKVEYQIDDPEHYYYEHYFLVCELWKLVEKESILRERYWNKARSLYFYWSGRRVIYSSGKKKKLSFESIGKIEEALNNGREEEAKQLLDGGA